MITCSYIVSHTVNMVNCLYNMYIKLLTIFQLSFCLMMAALKEVSKVRSFGGWQKIFTH